MNYVDLDNTVIDTIRRLGKEQAAARKHGFSDADYMRALHLVNERFGIGEFTIQRFFGVCRELNPALSDEVLGEWKEMENDQIFFDDSLEFLKSLPKKELCLITAGNAEMQTKKIDTHKLRPYFGKIQILPSPKANNIEPPEAGSVYIDDAPREIDAMKKRFPYVKCILVRTPPPWETQKMTVSADWYCPDLKTARKLLPD